jgi:hypothetical protein
MHILVCFYDRTCPLGCCYNSKETGHNDIENSRFRYWESGWLDL